MITLPDVNYIDIDKDAYLKQSNLVSGLAEAMQRYMIVLATPKGTRWKRPKFGCYIQNLLFEPFDQETADKIASELVDCTTDMHNDIADIKPTVEIVLDYESTSYWVNLKIDVLNRGTTSTEFNLRRPQ